jgi:pSer/pThr/pTyr-binding forkhead associated (FHA) protein
LEAPGNVYRFSHGRLDVGRVREVRDRDGRLVRRNTVVISDAHDPNGTVSRRHAHVKAVTGPEGHRFFAVYDDGSRYGTRIVRNGETLTVHPGTLGVRLRDGDELHFGEVMAFVRLDSEAASGAPA